MATTDEPPKTRQRRSKPRTAPGAKGSPPDLTSDAVPGEAAPPGPSRPKGTGTPTAPRAGTLQARLEEWLGALALPYSIVGDDYAASLIAARTPAMAEAWAELAKQNPAIKRVLERMIQGSAWGAVILSSGSLIIPLLAHHGILPLQSDPFSIIYGGATTIPQPGSRNTGSSGNGMPGWAGAATSREHDAEYQTPPMREGDPPGTFTVAGSNNAATMPPSAE